jgi:hypothetical protein
MPSVASFSSAYISTVLIVGRAKRTDAMDGAWDAPYSFALFALSPFSMLGFVKLNPAYDPTAYNLFSIFPSA